MPGKYMRDSGPQPGSLCRFGGRRGRVAVSHPIRIGRRGILEMTTAEYFDLVDRSGRMTRSDKRGAIDADLAPILLRIGANPEAWLDTVTHFGSRFRLAAGLVSSLREFADRLGRRWLQGDDDGASRLRVMEPGKRTEVI